jgi:hypothetical protein
VDDVLHPPKTGERKAQNHSRLRPVLLTLLFLVGLGLALFLAWYLDFIHNLSFEGPPRVQEIALGDLNGNGRLDAYLAVAPVGEPYVHPDFLLFNEGNGRFRDSGQTFGEMSRFSVRLGDVDGDGHLDIVVGQYHGATVYRRGVQGLFYGGGVLSISDGAFHTHVALADLNNNGSLDVFMANCCGGAIVSLEPQPLFSPDLVWLNDGNGRFYTNGQQLAQSGSNAVALGDLNGNGFPDAFIASGLSTNPDSSNSRETPNIVWFNDGQGQFQESGQRLGEMESMAVVLGDLNGNGFLDAVVGNRGPDEVWFNDGRGNFSDSEEQLGDGLTRSLFLVDLNGNGRLDLVIAGETITQVWLNNGSGRFEAGQQIDRDRYDGVAIGDVTGDGHADIFVAGVEWYQVWRGQGNGRFTADPRASFR